MCTEREIYTFGKEMRRSTRLYTYEESLTDGQEGRGAVLYC